MDARIYECGDESKRRTCMCCKQLLLDGDVVVPHPRNLYCLRHETCVPRSAPKSQEEVADARRFDRGRVIRKPGGL